MGTTSWQIGSHPAIGPVTVTVDGGSGDEDLDVITVEQGVYLYDNGSQWDALSLLQAALRTNPSDNLDNTIVYLTRDRKVRIEWIDSSPDPTNVEITGWSGAGADAFQELLGFTGAEVGAGYATTLTAAETSPYLWSCNKIETPLEARRGKVGAPYHDTAVGMSGTRVVVATTNNSGSRNTFHWERIANDRFWSASEDWGEYYVWWDYVQRRFRQFKIWQSVNELDGSTTAATIGAGLGPYIFRWDGATPLAFPHIRDIEFLEDLHTVDLPVVETNEYD